MGGARIHADGTDTQYGTNSWYFPTSATTLNSCAGGNGRVRSFVNVFSKPVLISLLAAPPTHPACLRSIAMHLFVYRGREHLRPEKRSQLLFAKTLSPNFQHRFARAPVRHKHCINQVLQQVRQHTR